MREKSEMLGNEKISKLLTQMSLPAIVGMVVNALYNLVDTIFVGQGTGMEGIGALAIAFPIQMLVVGIALMIGSGSASIISRKMGEGKQDEVHYVVGNTIILGVIAAVIVTLCGVFFLEPLLKLFGATETLLPIASQYVRVILSGSLFSIGTMITSDLLRAEGQMDKVMKSAVLATVINLVLDPIFIFTELNILGIEIPTLGMGVRGAAIATVIAQVVGVFYKLHFINGPESIYKFKIIYSIRHYPCAIKSGD